MRLLTWFSLTSRRPYDPDEISQFLKARWRLARSNVNLNLRYFGSELHWDWELEMLRCIIGEDRSGVQALGSACEGIPGVHNVGEIFHPSPRSRIHDFFGERRFSMGELRDGSRAFHLYREFFESVVNIWTKENYTENGLLFTLKYDTFLCSPGLAHYLNTAGVQFLHIYRRDIRSLVSSILDSRGWVPNGTQEDFAIVSDLAEHIECRRGYFSTLQSLRNWSAIANENIFESPMIDNLAARQILAEFFGLPSVDPLFPSTRPSIASQRREKIHAAVETHAHFLCETADAPKQTK